MKIKWWHPVCSKQITNIIQDKIIKDNEMQRPTNLISTSNFLFVQRKKDNRCVCCYNPHCAGVDKEVWYLWLLGHKSCGCGFDGCLTSTSLCVAKSFHFQQPGTSWQPKYVLCFQEKNINPEVFWLLKKMRLLKQRNRPDNQGSSLADLCEQFQNKNVYFYLKGSIHHLFKKSFSNFISLLYRVSQTHRYYTLCTRSTIM